MQKPIYILGTGLSHDGSACILKDGKLIIAIEKERISRIKHDGGNDSLAIQYCLDAVGIGKEDLSLVVQAANFEKDEIQSNWFKGKRIFEKNDPVPIISISHHLAHAYYAFGSSPFTEANVFVLDGCGSFYSQCDDLEHAFIPAHVNSRPGLYGEKDSYYHFTQNRYQSLWKDFSEISLYNNHYPVQLPTARHSIGGFYSMVSNYCFGSYDDAGKLMGLAPYGRKNHFTEKIFRLESGCVWVNEAVLEKFTMPADPIQRPFKENFAYYADLARWTQDALESIVLELINERLAFNRHQNFCYTGGVALNAVANKRIALESGIQNLYITPAAGDNGLGIGCAYYGWLQVLKKEKIREKQNRYPGKIYTENDIKPALDTAVQKYGEQLIINKLEPAELPEATAKILAGKKVIGWFQGGSELGPRALGHRSILAHPNIRGIRDHINHQIKLREDFRPFAPAILASFNKKYFVHDFLSAHMLLVNDIQPAFKNKVEGIVHTDGSCRVQTVTEEDDPLFYKLLESFYKETGIPVLLNTSLNRKGMPIAETPAEAIGFLVTSALEYLILHNYIIQKKVS